MLSQEQLNMVLGPQSPEALEAILETAECYEINTPQRMAAFLAQLGHESANLKVFEENLNYSADALLRVFGKYFKTRAQATAYARNPEKIANLVYANRMGNGDEASGDGWRYRGRGAIQLTGLNNYTDCSEALGEDFVNEPELLAQYPYSIQSAGWFWSENSINWFADRGDIVGMTKRINGGTNGLDHRQALYKRALQVLA